MIVNSVDAENDALLYAAKLMVAAARTAPKAGGRDSLKTLILTGDDKDKLADVMQSLGRVGKSNSKNMRDAGAVILIGIDFRGQTEECFSMKAKLLDLGIALGSAVKVASDLNIDNRIMYTIGAAAKDLGLLDSDVIMGIPLAVTGKSPYFDRG